MAAPGDQMEDMELVSKELLKVMVGGKAVSMLKHNLAKQEQMIDKLLDTQKTTAQLIKELMTTEEKVAQRLSDREEELNASLQKLQKIEERLLQANEEDVKMRTSTKELRNELETLKEKIRQQEKKSDEDANASMSATYLAHLYYQICHIDWDYTCEPTMIKGIHYGPDIAQPISMDSSHHSSCFISDYLWNLISTSW
ncbi:kinetochore protein Spc24 [Tiliqua scincoides]|uniref:kinetochore protein Spc24 n=1 Tax=Tiliqua scincoides TaxID=71010 RepID=UPI00346236AC